MASKKYDVPLKELRKMVQYIYDSEEKDYKSRLATGEDVKNHVMNHAANVARWLMTEELKAGARK